MLRWYLEGVCGLGDVYGYGDEYGGGTWIWICAL